MIDVLLGEDTKCSTSEEQLISYFPRAVTKKPSRNRKRILDAKYINAYDQIRSGKPELLKAAREIEHRSRLCRSEKKEHSGVIVFGKKGDDFTFRLGSDALNSHALSPQEALSLFQASESEQPREVSSSFDPIYQKYQEKYVCERRHDIQTGRRAKTLNKLKSHDLCFTLLTRITCKTFIQLPKN
jgi:hypothetical protein